MDRLDRTLDRMVDEGQLSVGVAAEISREFHIHPIDVRARLAELAGYAGAALAVIGLIVIGTQVWSDIGQSVRALAPAVMSAGLLIAAWLTARSVADPAVPTARSRLVQVLGLCSAVLASFTVVLAFPADPVTWQPTMAFGVGTVIVFVVSRWVPGFITTLAVAVYAYATGIAALSSGALADGGPGPAGAYSVVMGVLGATVAARFLPPGWFMQLLGLTSWLFGTLMLLLSPNEYEWQGDPRPYWMWLGRLSALALVLTGTWLFTHGADWPWAAGAAVGSAMLVGLWSAEAMNAGVALMIAGLVLIGVGSALASGRRASRHLHGESPPAKMEP